ncbi:MAG: thiamine pyrophosphate-binding protein, partial [bacterium]|nr:thiamine pyrophosphate-binding protein [bacterium]
MKGNINTAEFLVKCLEAEGVRYVFGVAGEENLLLLEAIRKSSIKFIVTRHEQAAVFMAATVGRWTGKIGVALSTLGPGATNLVTGIAYATLGGFPVLTISGQKPIRKSKQGKFQIIPVVEMMKPITKFAATIEKGEEAGVLFGKAMAAVYGGRPGAVHLELPEDVAEDLVKGDYVPMKPAALCAAGAEALCNALEIIEKAKHPILIIGAGANRRASQKELAAFVEKTKIPFITTQMGKGAIDESSKFYIGTTALSAGDYVHKAIEHSDAVIVVGHDTIEKLPASLPFGKQAVIHINFQAAEKDRVYLPTLEVIGDVTASLFEMTKKIKPNKLWYFSEFFAVRDTFQKSLKVHEAL